MVADLSIYLPELLRLVRLYYSGWNDFSHALFVQDEIDYKRAAAAFAREQLNRGSLAALLDAGDTAGFLARLNSVAGRTNLLYMGTPKTGDLALIKQPDADPGPICRAVFELLHGGGDAAERLGAFCDFVAANNLPQRWTFPTYFLFLLYPETEIFVKPRVTQWLSKFTDGVIPYDSQPGAAAYAAIRDGFHTLREGLAAYGAADLIDTQSFVYTAHQMATKGEPWLKAVETLRNGLAALGKDDYLRDIRDARDVVIGRFGPLFAPDRLASLTADEFTPFLDFSINRHWSGIHRQKSKLTAGNMAPLRAALAVLLDESRPLAERYDEATRQIDGMGRATATPILLVTYPDRYGVWNGKSEAGLRRLEILPAFSPGETEGAQYEAVNETLLWLAETLEIDLWTLDTLWEWLAKTDPKPLPLAPPFDAIFADRAQAEWAFDLFADAVERLGGGPDDPRFALTMIKKGISLLFGNTGVLDQSDRGRTFHLTALIELMNRMPGYAMVKKFSGESEGFGKFKIPENVVNEWPAELVVIYEQSMAEFGNIFKTWAKSNRDSSHVPELYEALFDEEKRDHLLTNGLSQTTNKPRYWRITMPSDLSDDLSNDRGPYNLWAECLRQGVAAIDFDNNYQHPQVKKFAQIAPGDRVVAFLRNRTIGGIGVVTTPFDEQTARERPPDRDYFRGGFWQRVGVDWTAKELNVDKLPKAVQNKFVQHTVIELTADEFAEVEKLMFDTPPQVSKIANEFKGFTADSFAFLRDLAENNNKAWMDANRERWKASVYDPMQALFADLGLPCKSAFDPYLVPDSLEIEPTTRRTLANIYKNWLATEDSLYHHYYWGAFFRADLKRQTDAQLFITMFADQFRFGFFVGRGASSVRNRFRERVLKDPEGFYRLIAEVGLAGSIQYGWSFESGVREVVDVGSADDLVKWVESGDFDLLRVLTPDDVVFLGPSLADNIFETFRRVFPIYLWAVADDYEDIAEQYLEAIIRKITGGSGIIDPPPTPYTFTDFIHHTHLTDADAADLRDMLEDKRQAIFYGPPGTGKTWVAKHLARLLTGLDKPPAERLTVVQFHPAYGYEEFIEGIRPKGEKDESGRTTVDYPVRPGIFVRFCREAERVDGPCVFIIDEINRGNIPRIFGELMYLLEYRDENITLPYSGERFRIPRNVHLIGTMNTADRSIALVDFALRRRFHFAHFRADPDLFGRWLKATPPTLPWLGLLYERLAAEAIDDPDYAIGHSVFMRPGLDEAGLRRVWAWSVMPLLREYHLDNKERAERWEWDGPEMRRLRGAADGGEGDA